MIDFQALLSRSPNPYVVLDGDLTMVWMNDAYLRTTMRRREDLLGANMFDAFPSAADSENRRQLQASFDRVLKTGKTDELAHIRYDIANSDGTTGAHFWSATHTPIPGADGEVAYILQHTVDVTRLQDLHRERDEMGVVERANVIQALNRDLAAQNERFQVLVEQAPGFICLLSGPNHRFELANRECRRIVGERDLVGRETAEALPEAIEQGFVQLLDKVRQEREPHVGKAARLELRNERTGEYDEHFLDFVYQPIFADSGEVSGVFVLGHDVTETVQAAERQDVLINELNHRVKNTLAIVQSLAQQSFAGAADETGEDFENFSARLAALASAHNLLTACSWEKADLREIIAGSLQATAGFDARRYDLDGPRAVLHPQPAVALAMIVHELSTNAIKHGAFSTPRGRVSVSWTARPEGDRCRVAIDWVESGGPAVAPPARQGFGTRLIRRGLGDRESQVTIDYRREGLRCRIEALA